MVVNFYFQPMKKTLPYLLSIAILCLVAGGHAQTPDEQICISRFEAAYTEITDMLDGKDSVDLKRAVFLMEWAVLDGGLDYDAYCFGIDTMAMGIKRFIEVNNLDMVKIGGNIALLEFFSRPYTMNGFRPFVYDFDDFRGDKDPTKVFVTKLMRTHDGQCRSLPLLYKILANEIGIEAYIAYAPNHTFIRHRDEEDRRWINVELTNHSLPREIFIVETMGITEEAIKKGIYLKPCEDREVVIHLLAELAVSFFNKFCFIDPFVHKCLGKVLKYDPDNLYALMNVNDCFFIMAYQHRKELEAQGLPNDKFMDDVKFILQDLEKRIKATGHVDMPKHLYDAWVKSMEEEIARRKSEEHAS